jgi:hypothetical protein
MEPWNGVERVVEAAETKRVEARCINRAGNKEGWGKGRGLLRGRAVLETKKAGGIGPPAGVLVDGVGFSLLPSPLAGEGLGMRGDSLPLTLTQRERGSLVVAIG